MMVVLKVRNLKVAIFYVLFSVVLGKIKKEEERNMKFNFLPRKHLFNNSPLSSNQIGGSKEKKVEKKKYFEHLGTWRVREKHLHVFRLHVISLCDAFLCYAH